MGISDSRFNAREHYSYEFAKELRALVNHPDGLDPGDTLIFSIEYLLQAFVKLSGEGLIAIHPKPEEAMEWRDRFIKRFESWGSSAAYEEMLKAFDAFVGVCVADS